MFNVLVRLFSQQKSSSRKEGRSGQAVQYVNVDHSFFLYGCIGLVVFLLIVIFKQLCTLALLLLRNKLFELN